MPLFCMRSVEMSNLGFLGFFSMDNINLFKITTKCIEHTIWYRKVIKTNISYINKDVNCSQIVQPPLQQFPVLVKIL